MIDPETARAQAQMHSELASILPLLDLESVAVLRNRAEAAEDEVVFRQTNHEGQLVDWIHDAIDTEAAGIIINPAGLTFRSIPVLDALKMVRVPIIELHISNIHRREAIYHHSLVSAVATAVIAGLGARGYATSMRAMREMLDGRSRTASRAGGRDAVEMRPAGTPPRHLDAGNRPGGCCRHDPAPFQRRDVERVPCQGHDGSSRALA